MREHAVSEPPSSGPAWALGALVGVSIAGACIGYAFLTPAVYKASALIEVWPTNANAKSDLEPLEASRRLQEVVLDREVLSELARERAGSDNAANPRLGHSIESALQIDSVDARAFTITFRDSSSARVAKTCNWLAERLIERAPRALGGNTPGEDGERRRRVAALVQFLSAHPELGVAANAAATSLPELSAEKARIEASLLERQGSDGEQVASLVRRLADVNAAIALRSAPAGSETKAAPPESQRMLEQLARAVEAMRGASPRESAMQARIVARAEPPTWPIDPDRPRWLALAFVAGALSSLLVAFVGRRRPSHYLDSTPPPSEPSAPPPSRPSSSPPQPAEVPQPAPSHAPAPSPPSAEPPVNEAPSPIDIARESLERLARDAEPPVTTRYVSAAPRVERSSAPAADRSEGDRITPISSFPPRVAGGRGDRAMRAALEVNAELKRNTSSNPPPAHEGLSAHTTHALGSPIPPILAPGSRRAPLAGTPHTSAPVSVTAYSYVSTPAPPSMPSLDDPSFHSGPPTRRFMSAAAPAPKDWTVVSIQRGPTGWRPDLSLLPESRRGLCDEIYPLAVDNCCVVAVLGGAEGQDAKSRLAAELALALAESGHPRVLILEGDAERSSVRRFLRAEMPPGAGFSEQIRARISPRPPQPWNVVECSQSLHMLAEGSRVEPDLILSRQFEDCIRELRRFYDFVVIDGPTISNVAACRAVHDVVDRVVFSHGRFGPAELAQASELFPDKRISVVPAFS